MNATARGLIERAADRMDGTVYDLVRGIALDSSLRIHHSIATKDAVEPSDGPLSARRGYPDLHDAFLAEAVLPRVGAAEIPFATPSAILTGPPTAAWVTRGEAKPVTKATIAKAKHDPLKVSAITVLTTESLRWSGPDADAALRRTLAYAATTAVNGTFLSAVAAETDESPAGVAFGLTPLASSGDVFEDLTGLLDGLRAPTVVASLTNALRIRAATLNASELPVVVAPEAGSTVYAIDRFAVAFSLGRIDVDASEHAAIAMSDEPDAPAQLVSMFQTDSRAVRVSVFANWTVVRPDGVRVLEMEGS